MFVLCLLFVLSWNCRIVPTPSSPTCTSRTWKDVSQRWVLCLLRTCACRRNRNAKYLLWEEFISTAVWVSCTLLHLQGQGWVGKRDSSSKETKEGIKFETKGYQHSDWKIKWKPGGWCKVINIADYHSFNLVFFLNCFHFRHRVFTPAEYLRKTQISPVAKLPPPHAQWTALPNGKGWPDRLNCNHMPYALCTMSGHPYPTNPFWMPDLGPQKHIFFGVFFALTSDFQPHFLGRKLWSAQNKPFFWLYYFLVTVGPGFSQPAPFFLQAAPPSRGPLK